MKQQGGSAHLDGHGSQTVKRGKGGWRRPTMTQQRFNNNAVNNETAPGLIEGTGRDTSESESIHVIFAFLPIEVIY